MTAPTTFGSRMLDFYTTLVSPRLPHGVEVMNPYSDERVRGYVRQFGERYFADNAQRVLVFGINPGRFGAGVTGVTFTDPAALADAYGIENHLARRREPSSIFVQMVIARMGGAAAFYRSFFLTALSPLGFTRDGKNLNYYDDPNLVRAVMPFIMESIERQIAMGGRRDHAIVLGAGENLKFMQQLNKKHGYFGAIHPLGHPRFIMQYRYRRLEEFLSRYEETFARAARG